ncbi:hypothetical protein TrLO_g13590 [Triparma laevis f. longispina]|uniref:Major facilitator superfamily (MFS) profile domain-containing protein n=1 Tax=Triparma laevis f. longispina TaxID=1714387 RepID=A0A9W7EHS4_9STRA|nr:hypothetical protein TrLO_g13590 [Triparma laevis f. longispina]
MLLSCVWMVYRYKWCVVALILVIPQCDNSDIKKFVEGPISFNPLGAMQALQLFLGIVIVTFHLSQPFTITPASRLSHAALTSRGRFHEELAKARPSDLARFSRLGEGGGRRNIALFGLGESDEDLPAQTEIGLEPHRYINLALLSLLALLSDLVCFATSSTPSIFSETYPGHTSASLIDVFLFTNVASCFFVTDTVKRLGLANSIKGASLLMFVGCLLRAGGPLSGIITPYPILLAGTVLVGLSQPFFQCTPPLLSATWFGSNERAMSTAVALNFNQIGIACAFLIGGSVCGDAESMMRYFEGIAATAGILSLVTAFGFRNKPTLAPSSSELRKIESGEEEPPFFSSVQTFLKNTSFYPPLIAFVTSITLTNIVGAFIDEVMIRGGIEDQMSINLAGAGFELAILLGGLVVGGYVDKTKAFKRSTLVCLGVSFFLLFPLGLTEHAIGKEPALVLVSLFGLGFVAGPIQPVNAELAVEVTFPSDETAVESSQQIFGNLISALIIPLAEMASKKDITLFPTMSFESDIRGDVILLAAIAAGAFASFSKFDGKLARSLLDCGDEGGEESEVCNVILEGGGGGAEPIDVLVVEKTKD